MPACCQNGTIASGPLSRTGPTRCPPAPSCRRTTRSIPDAVTKTGAPLKPRGAPPVICASLTTSFSAPSDPTTRRNARLSRRSGFPVFALDPDGRQTSVELSQQIGKQTEQRPDGARSPPSPSSSLRIARSRSGSVSSRRHGQQVSPPTSRRAAMSVTPITTCSQVMISRGETKNPVPRYSPPGPSRPTMALGQSRSCLGTSQLPPHLNSDLFAVRRGSDCRGDRGRCAPPAP